MNALKRLIEALLPRGLYRTLVRPYHFLLTASAALASGFPARNMTVIAVTGTKGKSTVTEMLFAVLRHAGFPAAVAGTIRFAINDETRPNLYKMTLPGRGFIQRFLKEARGKGATHAVVEVTSESTLQYRHLFLYLDALVFTNLQKEHIESHGSFEKYAAAKLRIGKALARSPKRPRAIIANADTEHSAPFLALAVEERLPFSYADAHEVSLAGGYAAFTYKDVRFSLKLPGGFTVMNALAVIKAAEFLGIPLPAVSEALANLERIPGRTERIEEGQDFHAIVDYAHTPDSLQALYDAYPERKVCVLGNTGGGRDAWKRPEMGRIADAMCDAVILTDEDPYDEDPLAIVEAMKAGMEREPLVIMDRREAIRHALSLARPGDAVLITGKGTDPYIMQAHGTKLPWSDAQVVREELKNR
ncbi:MAG TPA: UDP-N-acetylmuramyl-tripeptide synthetase [Candidatus Paceibacterota bacterium]|nr:UDP-N-acetylmuramyl-tripeptide synthetase [Candidatus Paceibacterota bacterium]